MRKPLDVPIESRDGNKTLTKDSLLCNFAKDPLEPEKILKRPGMWQTNVFAPTGQGSGIYSYKDTIYNWIDTSSGSGSPLIPTTGVIDESVMVRGILDFVDNGDGTYTLTLSPNNPYIVGDFVDIVDNVVVSGTEYEITNIVDDKLTISLVVAPLWSSLGAITTPSTNYGFLGFWFLNGSFYIYCYSDAGLTSYNLYKSSGDISLTASYSLVSSGLVPAFDTANTIPATEIDLIAITPSGSTGYFVDSSITGNAYVYTSTDGFNWTSPLYDTGILYSGISTAYFGGYIYEWQSGGGLWKGTPSTTVTLITTSGLSVLNASYVALVSNGSYLYLIEGNNTSKLIKINRSSDGVNWSLVSSTAYSGYTFARLVSVSVNAGIIYCLLFNGATKLFDLKTTDGTDVVITDSTITLSPNYPNYIGYTTNLYCVLSNGITATVYKRASL
jgi:hypothetical protein